MALTDIQQFQKLSETAKHVLIAFRKDGSIDSVASAAALCLHLEKQGKRVDMVSDGFVPIDRLRFLKHAEKIRPAVSDLQKFMIAIDIAKAGLKELSYDVKDETLRIFITPKAGSLAREQVKTAQTDFKYDLVVVLDTSDLHALGGVYENNTELFHKVPVVNIDHHAANEHFGTINMITTAAAATTEVLFDLFKQIGAHSVDDAIATALLTGIIANTKSFKSDNIKPHTLSEASELMKLGGDRTMIVRHLYHTKTLATLKLWGKTLSHLAFDKEAGLVWASLTRDDFVRAGTTEADLADIVDEIIGDAPEARVVALLHEHVNNGSKPIHAIVHADKGIDARLITKPFQPVGNADRVSCVIEGKTLKEAEDILIAYIRESVSNI